MEGPRWRGISRTPGRALILAVTGTHRILQISATISSICGSTVGIYSTCWNAPVTKVGDGQP